VAHNADDFRLHIELQQMDAFPDRIFIGRVGVRENVVDVNNDGGAKYRGLDEHAYFDQGGTTPFVRA
jgi:hypothetical protein